MKKQKAEKKSIPIWLVAVICLAAGLLIASIVFIVLVKVSEANDLREAKELAGRIPGTSESVKAFLYGEDEGEAVSEETKELLTKYEDAVDEISGLMNDLGKKRVTESGDIKEKYEKASELLGNLQRVSEIERLLMDALEDGALSDEELEKFSGADSEYLQNLAKDYKEYRAKVAEFNEKYADLKDKNKSELDADYAKIQQDGDELAKKYAEIKFDDVYGMSRDDIYKFYATIEELNETFDNRI